MNRAGHITSGLAAGAAVYPLVDNDATASGLLTAGMVTAAAALLPDLDHPNSTATRRFGPITKAVSTGMRATSAGVYRLTKGPRDENVTGKHRHLSHTFLFAALLGVGVTVGCHAATTYDPLAGLAAVVLVLLMSASLAATYFGAWTLAAPAVLAASVFTSGHPVVTVTDLSGQLGWYVAIGCAVHCLGDALTEHGCPFLYPIPIRGETFYEIRPPRPLRFTTGGFVERVLVVVFLALAAVFAVTALAPDLVGQLATAAGGER